METRDREQIKVRLCWEDCCVEGTAGQAAGGEGELTKRLEDLETRDREQIKARLCWEDW